MGGVKNPSPVEVQDEGVKITTARTVDFTGAGVVASGAGSKVEVAISGGGGMATHAFLTEYHGHPAGASGNVLTNLGSGAIPTYTTPVGGIGTHNIGGAEHADAVVVSPEDMEVIAYHAGTSLFKNLKLHGTLIKVSDFHGGGTLALTLGSLSGRLVASQHPEVDHYTGGISPLTVGSLPGNLGHLYYTETEVDSWRTGHVGSAAAHHAKYTDAEAQAIADTQVSIHAALVGIHHSPTHNLGGADHNPDTFAHLNAKVNDATLLKVGDSNASLSLWAGHIGSIGAHHTAVHHHAGGTLALTFASISGHAGHIGSTGAHHTYPVPSGGIASGAIPFLELRTIHPVASGYSLQALASGGVPTWGALIAGPTGPTGPIGPTGSVGPTGPVCTTYSHRAPMWYTAGTLSVGSQIAAQLFCDGSWAPHALRGFVLTPPSGAAITFDINAAGASLFASLPSIPAGSQSIGAYSFATTGIASGARLSFDVDVIGSSHAGEDLSVQLTCKETL